MGAPGYSPHIELPPHAPMPGAPPYPAAVDHPPPPVGRSRRGTSILTALTAAAVWAVVDLVLHLLAAGSPPPGAAGLMIGGLVLTTALAGLIGWLVARRREWPFWLLVLVLGPIYWVLRAVTLLLLG